ncbi:MAG: integrase arm-type DNA-binding domain-containing protein [Novosphingobium sp.]|nr:integrase arm-type DNA-binding domain-containing protein [Novosphingobium sp.]
MAKPTSLLKGFEKTVETVRANPAKRQVLFDGSTTGLALIVSPKGKKSFAIVARDPNGKQVWKTIGDPATMTIAKARQEAAEAVARVKAGEAPVLPPEPPQSAPETFKEVAERFVKRWVRQGGKKQDGEALRSAHEIERQFKAYLYPRWGEKPFLSIRRGVVTELVDHLVENNGAVQADRVLATLSKLFNWYRQYDENYVNPIIPEMRRSGSMKDRARARILSDDEIRAVWEACGKIGTFGAFVRVSLLTGQRRAKVATMRWEDISADGVWTIPAEAREKVNAGSLTLPKMARDLIDAQPKVKGNPFVFAGRGKLAFNSFSDGKQTLQETAPIAPWVTHDLRRTAKSLMVRAGVRPDISERTLGHVIAGVEGVYDRHGYANEKSEALAALAALLGRILKGETDNVVPLKAASS